MGTKRTQDSGKKDSLGRSIKVSGNAATPAAGSGSNTDPTGDFGDEANLPSVDDEVDALTDLIARDINPSRWDVDALEPIYSPDSGFLVDVMKEQINGVEAAIVISEATGRAYGVSAQSGYDAVTLHRTVPLEKVTETVPKMTIGPSSDEIADPELAASIADFVKTHAKGTWSGAAKAIRTDDLYGSITDGDGRTMYELGATQDKDPWDDSEPLGVSYSLWDNGQTQNARQYEYGMVYYDPKLGRGLMMISKGASEFGASSGDLMVTDSGLMVNDPDSPNAAWTEEDDRLHTLTPDGSTDRTRYAPL